MRIWKPRRSTRKFRLTREGKAFLFVTIGVGLAAVNTANNLLYLVLGLLLSLLLVSGVLSDLALWRLRVVRKLPKHMFANTESLIEIHAKNLKRRLASVGVEVHDEIQDLQTSPSRFVRIGASSSATVAYHCKPARRGLYRFQSLRVMTRYPFGLIEKGHSVFAPDEIIVYPKLLGSMAPPLMEQVSGDAIPMHRTGTGTEFAGSVRGYRDGDVARDIHWRRTAARGKLVVKEREQDARALVTLFVDNAFDTMADADVWNERFEEAISEAATLAAAYLSRGVSVQVNTRSSSSTIVPGGAPPDPIWRYLALLEPVHPSRLSARIRLEGQAA